MAAAAMIAAPNPWSTSVTPRTLALLGMAFAGPAFVMNVIWHAGTMPGPDEVDRLDGFFSLVFMVGAGAVVAGLLTVEPSPVGRKGRVLLYVEAALVVAGGTWAAIMINDPGAIDSNNPVVLIGDASWPLHQALMLVTGTVAWRAHRWTGSARYALYGPAIGLAALGVGFAAGIDLLAAAGIGSGWVIAALGIIAMTPEPAAQDERLPRGLPSAA